MRIQLSFQHSTNIFVARYVASAASRGENIKCCPAFACFLGNMESLYIIIGGKGGNKEVDDQDDRLF